jgi:uncharacterized phage protein gp47/JayE
MQTLSALLKSPTKDDLRASLLRQLQGVGFTSLVGFSPGTVTLSGVPTAEYDVRVKLIASGNLGAATFQYSTDGGLTYSSTSTVPSGGTFAMGGTSLSLVFANSADTTVTSFIAGDVFRVQTRLPTLPSTSWQTGSVPLTLVENDAAVMEDLYALVTAVASGGLLETSAGPWLDLLASQVYQLTRNAGVLTIGTVTLTAAAGAGPYTIVDGQLWFAASNGLRYVSSGSYTLPLGGSVSVTVRAEAPSAAYNVGNGTITTLITALAGVTVANPDPGTGTWITTQGANVETDLALRARCRARWPTLGTGTPSVAYALWARTADPSITRTRVRVSSTVAGQVEVYLAGSSGPVGAPAVTNATNYIAPRVPLCVTALVQSAAAVAVTVTATVYVKTALLSTATAQCTSNLTALFSGGTSNLGEVLPGIDIGGTVYLSAIIEQLMQADGVRNVVVTTPATDTALTATQVATLTQSLTFVGV